MTSPFWQHIAEQYTALTKARTVDEVLATCPPIEGLSCGDGFFEGSGGDLRVVDALTEAAWVTVVYRAHYYWVMRSPTGDLLTYAEGDLYRGDRITAAAS